MFLKDTLVISICNINATEMLHLRTASFQWPAMLLQFVKQKFGWSDYVYEADWFKLDFSNEVFWRIITESEICGILL